jgi:ABC-2 type transport system permease protein
MSLVNLYKYKDYLTVAVSFMLVAFGIKILMVLSQQLPNIGGPDLLDSIKSGNVDFIGGVGSSFPPSIWATYASCSGFPEGIAYMLAIIAGAVVALVLLMISCNLFYFPSILNGSFSSSSNGTLRDSKIVKIKRLRPEISIFKSEWKTFLRTPVFFTNGLMVTVLMVFIPFLFDGNQAIEKSVEFISGSSHPVRTVILCFAIISLCSCVSIIPSTAISREGKSLWVMLVSPIGLESALRGKVLHAISVTIINVMVSSLVLILYFHVNMAYVVEGAVMALCIAVAVINFNILIDLTKPKLNWKDPFEVLKVNLNILVEWLYQ